MNKIKTETCTSIIIPSDAKAGASEALPPDVIRIEGDPKGVAAAKKMILEMAAKLVRETVTFTYTLFLSIASVQWSSYFFVVKLSR